MAIVETAKSSGQLIAAIASLREIRSNLELQGKLSGELSSQNINFFNNGRGINAKQAEGKSVSARRARV